MSSLIESIAAHYAQIDHDRVLLLLRIGRAFGDENKLDFTWLYARDWEVKGERLFWASCDYPAFKCLRGIDPSYVFVLSDRENGDHPEGFIAVLRAAQEKKTT